MAREISRTDLVEDLVKLRRKVERLEPLFARAEQAEDEYARFFAQSLDLLCIAGLDGYFKRVNPAWTDRLGWTEQELRAVPFLSFVHPDDREVTLAEFSGLVEGADTVLLENRYRHRNGTYRWLQWTARPVPGRRRIYATARDVTRRKRLEKEILEIADQEKERLGQELHDGLCQTLAGVAALSATLSRRLAATSEAGAAAAADEIASLLNQTIGQVRDMARGLGQVGLNEAGLDRALEALALNVEHMFGVACDLRCEPLIAELRGETEQHLFRIAQEAVNNAVAHGQAKKIGISVTRKGGRGLLRIQDDGVGLSADGSDSDGIGLHTMTYRARLIGGSLKVRRRCRRGTSVVCLFPLPANVDSGKSVDDAVSDA